MLNLRALAFASALIPCAALAQPAPTDYPNKSIRFIVAFAPTGVSDVVGRTIAMKLGEVMGQQVVVENRGGAGGAIGTELLARAAPDGYTLGLCSLTTNAVVPNVLKKIGYHPIDDFAPISLVTTSPNLIAVNNAVPARTLGEVIALAKAKPGQLAFASSGYGSMMHLAGEMMRSQAGIEWVHVPYKGVALAYPDVLSGQVPIIFDSVVSASPHIKAGKIRPIAVTSRTRSAALPDVPTMAEAGLPDYEMNSWNGICAPAKTPAPIIARLTRDVNTAVRAPDVRERLTAAGADVLGTGPKELLDIMRRDLAAMARVVKSAAIQPE